MSDLKNNMEELSVHNDLKPIVTIVVPCYNVEAYLEDCLKSLINQTFKKIEIVCINDGSTDSTPEILDKFAKIDSRIKVVTQKNGGLSCARNTGVNNSSGEYITFIDSDDWINETYIEKLYNSLVSKNCDIAIAEMIRKRPKSEKYRLHFKEEQVFETLSDKINACRIPTCCYVCGKLFKRELIKDFPFKNGVYFEDVIWTPEVVKKSNKLVVVPKAYYYYRVNNNSIVKKKQSDKKLLDSYRAHKYIIKFFRENNLQISPKYEHVTRKIVYIFNCPIMKIKEYKGKEQFYLFGFIPFSGKLYTFMNKMFSVSDIDSHRMIYIFGLQIRKKYKTKPIETVITESGITENKRTPKVILSLTTFPDRINSVSKTIKTLLNQTMKADEVVLWLAESQFPQKENELPQELLDLKNYGLTIDWCEDIRSYKKLVPALKKYPDDIIITFDDDIYYDRDVVENLYESYLQNPKCIHANRGHRVFLKNNHIKPKKNAEMYWTRYLTPSFKNTIIGCGGVLYPPHCLSGTAIDDEKFRKIIPTQDDLWFWAMALLNNTKIQIVSSFDMQIKSVENTQQHGLCKINNTSNKGVNGKDGFKIIEENFSNIIDIIKNEK